MEIKILMRLHSLYTKKKQILGCEHKLSPNSNVKQNKNFILFNSVKDKDKSLEILRKRNAQTNEHKAKLELLRRSFDIQISTKITPFQKLLHIHIN